MVADLVRRARRRFLQNEILASTAYAGTGAFAALILLLVLGTQLLTWQWLLILPLASLGAALYRTWKMLPSPYAVAQMVDRRLGLEDVLSTALFYSGDERQASPEILRAQRQQADEAARGVSVNDAVPFAMPRAMYAMAILAVVASSLFALRYGLERRLDLQQPLARMVQQALGIPEVAEAAVDKKKPAGKQPLPEEVAGLSLPDSEAQESSELDAAPESALDTVGVPDTSINPENAREGQAKGKAAGDKMQDGEGSEEGEESAGASTGSEAGDGQQGASKQNQKGGKESNDRQADGGAGDKSSLMAKFKEAMSNLLSRVKQPPSQSGAQQQASQGQSGQKGQNQQGGNGQKSERGQQQSGGQEADGQDGQAGEESQNAENAAGRGAGQNADQQASKQPGSGMGKQDGSKDVKTAEQLAAMGKISEIIGKRAANLTGEITVEVQNTSQQLSTPYSQRQASHAESGSDISRDEVPVALQVYVQEYFEQVRKQPAKP